MLGKLHLICMKTKDFYAKNRCDLNKLDVISPTFHTSVKRRKIISKSLLNPPRMSSKKCDEINGVKLFPTLYHGYILKESFNAKVNNLLQNLKKG